MAEIEALQAELAGIMLGDGCIGTYKSSFNGRIKTKRKVQITLHSEEVDYAKHVSSLISQVIGKKPLLSLRKTERALDLCFFDKESYNFFTNTLGLTESPKWNTAHVPDAFMTPELGKYVLRGYADTDGCVTIMNNNGTRYPRIEMKVCPSPMQAQLVSILDSLGFKHRVYDLDKGRITIHLAGKKQLRKWIDEVGFSNPKNLERALSFFND